MLIDTHSHLNFADLQKDLSQVIKRSLVAGVKKIICVSSNVGDSQKALQIAKVNPGIVYAAVGIHPQQTDPGNDDAPAVQIKKLAALISQKTVVAIGECGLDFTPAPPGEKERSKAEQIFLFEWQIKLAQQSNLPVIIHSRKSFQETIDTLEGKQLRGVFHCYSGGKKGISQIEALGFLFGLDGNLTYDEGLQNVTAQIPLERIVLETDAPFLSPDPYRGQRNEPKNLPLVAECLAEIKKTSVEKVWQTTTINAKKLFRL